MRRSDIARISVVTDGADYIFTLPEIARARGRRVIALINLLKEQEHYLIVSSDEEANQSLQGHDGNASDFPRYYPRFVHEPVGVHRYKPELQMVFPPFHP